MKSGHALSALTARKTFLALVFTALFGFANQVSSQGLIKVIVEQNLYNNLTSQVTEYLNDLAIAGFTTSLSTGTWENPADVRALLQAEQENGLVGGVLIGEVPLAKFNLTGDLGDLENHDFNTVLYYMDIDGTWGGEQNGVFTSHFGNYQADIWIGVIRAENLAAKGNSVTLIGNYLSRVHSYRNGGGFRPPHRAFNFYHERLPNYTEVRDI